MPHRREGGIRHVDIDDRLNAWRACDLEASRAEAELERIGQGAQDPRLAELHERARLLRQRADAMLSDIVASLKGAPRNG